MINHSSAKKFKIITLGCRTNQYESQAYQNQLLAMGYQMAKEEEEAEICIVNTCTVTESADSSSRHAIRQLARHNQNAKLVVTGCFADRQPEVVKNLSENIYVVPNAKKEQLIDILFPDIEEFPEFRINCFEAHTRAFVKIQDGCNSYCSYCIIPFVRGRSRSRTITEIKIEVQLLIQQGYKEIVLTGINIGDFDGNTQPKARLAHLIKELDELPGLERLRVSSIDPDEVDDELLEVILHGKTTCHSMHIVLQSGSNFILKSMNRGYTRQIFFDTIDRLRNANPDFTFTTDVIVGFPGETDQDFTDTLDVIKQVKFAKVHMFPYSDRPKTRSSRMLNKISPDVMKKRKQEVLRLAEENAFILRNQYIGRKMVVLTENRQEATPDQIMGHTANFLPVWIQSVDLLPNQLVMVDLVDNRPDGLIGYPKELFTKKLLLDDQVLPIVS